MDLATIIGLVSGFILIVFVGIGDPRKIAMFVDLQSIAITFGGVFSAIMVAYPFSSIIGAISVARNAFLSKTPDLKLAVSTLLILAERARKEGILSLDSMTHDIEDEFLRKGISLAVDGTDPTLLREILTVEIDSIDARHRSGMQIFEDIGMLGPAFGLVGTLVGLVMMLGNMSDPSSIGPAMAVALITTFYGALIANLVSIPIAIKLRGLNHREILVRTVILEGIMAIQNGENPRLLETKLCAFLSPDERLNLVPPPKKEERIG